MGTASHLMDLLTSHQHSICSNCHRLSTMFGVFLGLFQSVTQHVSLLCCIHSSKPRTRFSSQLAQLERKQDSKITLHTILPLPSRASTDEACGTLRMICRAAGKQDTLQILSQQVLGELIRLFGTALQACPGEPTALEMACAPVAV